jgi:hypothetical protein
MRKLKYVFLIVFPFFIHSYTFATSSYGSPAPVDFNIDLQAGSATFDMTGAKTIAHALFYIAVAIGGINVVRTMVFSPDRAKKIIINWCVGIIVFAVVINICG